MVRTEIKHEISSPRANLAGEARVIRTIKTVRILGIVVYTKVYHYPELETYEVANV